MTNTGERIRFLRNLRGMTQKGLGTAVGFSEKTADIRIAQYESGKRVPKADIAGRLADVLSVSPAALNVSDISNPIGVMHTLFALEDIYDVSIGIDRSSGRAALYFLDNPELSEMVESWLGKALLMMCGEITPEEYDNWRYNFGCAN